MSTATVKALAGATGTIAKAASGATGTATHALTDNVGAALKAADGALAGTAKATAGALDDAAGSAGAATKAASSALDDAAASASSGLKNADLDVGDGVSKAGAVKAPDININLDAGGKAKKPSKSALKQWGVRLAAAGVTVGSVGIYAAATGMTWEEAAADLVKRGGKVVGGAVPDPFGVGGSVLDWLLEALGISKETLYLLLGGATLLLLLSLFV